MEEERTLVESLVKIAAGIGTGLAFILTFFILNTSSLVVQWAMAVSLAIVTCVSFEAAPVLQDGQRTFNSTLMLDMCREWSTLLSKPALRHFVSMRFWQGAAEATILTFVLYYATVIGKTVGTALQEFLTIVSCCVVGAECLLLPIFTLTFHRHCCDMQWTCFIMHSLAVVVGPCTLAFLPFPPQWRLLSYIIFQKSIFAPQTW